MPDTQSPHRSTPKPAEGTTTRRQRTQAFTDEERAAMKERSREMKARRAGKGQSDGEAELLAKYATLGFSDSANLAEGAIWPVAYALKEPDTQGGGENRSAHRASRELRRQREPTDVSEKPLGDPQR